MLIPQWLYVHILIFPYATCQKARQRKITDIVPLKEPLEDAIDISTSSGDKYVPIILYAFANNFDTFKPYRIKDKKMLIKLRTITDVRCALRSELSTKRLRLYLRSL